MTAKEYSSIRAVVFDAVGTLIYPFPPVAEAYHLAGWSNGSKLPVTQIWRRFRAAFAKSQLGDLPPGDGKAQIPRSMGEGRGEGAPQNGDLRRAPTSEAIERERWRQIVGEVFTDVPDAVETIYEMLWKHFAQPENWRQYGDVSAIWPELQARGYALGIASNFDERLRGVLRGHEPLDRCEALFVSSQIGFPKPAPEFFAGIEERLALPGEQILLVGDDELNDYQAARAAGWRALRLQRGSETEQPDCIHTLAQLLEILPSRGDR